MIALDITEAEKALNKLGSWWSAQKELENSTAAGCILRDLRADII